MDDNKVDDEEWRTAGIEKAIRSIERGGGIPHEKVRGWVESWGSSVELQAPTVRRVGKIARE
jgi:predicted transcriptional regulator